MGDAFSPDMEGVLKMGFDMIDKNRDGYMD
jgi:hypothetical protein